MITIFDSGKVELCFVLLPEDVTGYKFHTSRIIFDVKYGLANVFFDLPTGNWTNPKSPLDVTEEEARELVPFITRRYGSSYYDYNVKFKVGFGYTGTALESWHSLLSHL